MGNLASDPGSYMQFIFSLSERISATKRDLPQTRAVSATVCTASLDQVLDPTGVPSNYSNVWTSLDRTLCVGVEEDTLFNIVGGCLVSCIARADLAETKA